LEAVRVKALLRRLAGAALKVGLRKLGEYLQREAAK
jgi:hypothetical protein